MKQTLIAFGLCAVVVIGYLVLALTEQPNQGEATTVEIRQEKVLTFCRLVSEYNHTVQMEQLAVPGEARETAHMIQFFTFQYLADYYWNVFNPDERLSIFSSDSWCKDFPHGIVLGLGGPIDSLLGTPLTTGNPQQDFEDFLNYSFREIDYQSTFSILQKGGEFERIQSEVRRDLAKRFPR